MLPLFFDVSKWKVVVFGGGAVGIRKARYFSTYAEVTVVTKEPIELENVHLVIGNAEELMGEWISWADIVIDSYQRPWP